MLRKGILLISMFVIGIASLSPEIGNTIPAFARKYGFSCSTCHEIVPKLKEYGDEFAANAFQLPDDEEPVRAFKDVGDDRLLLQRELPIAIRLDSYVRYRTEGDINSDIETPFGVKILSGGNIAKDIGYYFYFYMNERGEITGLEDAYVHFNNLGGTEFDIMVGQFQISDPLFKRELRLTFEDYQIYKAEIGNSQTNLTYDRGIIMSYSLPTKTDLLLEIVNGSGIGDAGADQMFDEDKYKNVFFKIAQGIPFGTVGFFGYLGKEKDTVTASNWKNEFQMFGPDISLGVEKIELNAQFIRRTDKNPMFNASPGDDTVTNGIIAEMVVNPIPEKSHLYGVLLYNNISSDYVSADYETITANISYLLRTNLRLMGEFTRDLEMDESRLTFGWTAGF
ncbi:hypothetical protein ACFL6H_08140 [Candidatus Latescibacterota bacterium]